MPVCYLSADPGECASSVSPIVSICHASARIIRVRSSTSDLPLPPFDLMIRINGYARDIFHRLSLPVSVPARFLQFREGVLDPTFVYVLLLIVNDREREREREREFASRICDTLRSEIRAIGGFLEHCVALARQFIFKVTDSL